MEKQGGIPPDWRGWNPSGSPSNTFGGICVMKKIPRSPLSIWLAKEIYLAFAQSVKSQGKAVCFVLEEFMSAYSGAHPYEEPEENKMQFIEAPTILPPTAPSNEEIKKAQEHLKNTLLQHMDVIRCLSCGEIRPLAAPTKTYLKKESIAPRCFKCNQLAEVVEHAPSVRM